MSQSHPSSVLAARDPDHAYGRHEIHHIVAFDWMLEPATRAVALATTRAIGLSALAAIFTSVGVTLVLAEAGSEQYDAVLGFAPLVMFALSMSVHGRAMLARRKT